MPRRNSPAKRSVLPDPKFNSIVVAKLINQVMMSGKKSIAQEIVYSAFDKAGEKLGVDGVAVFSKALENVMPVLETKARRVGGSNYQVPVEVRPERRQTLAIRWIVQFARQRSERDMDNKLAGELVDAYNNAGGAVKRKEEMHRMAEANKAFAHFKF
ncbi:MAG TPA: 30S ribosomal protein S7 [Clostridiales bacterium]|nr:30S ribosomal protein S7 [Clostridiales bacterium]